MSDYAEILAANRFFMRLELQMDDNNETVDAVFLECQRFERSQPAVSIVEVSPRKWANAKHGLLVTTKIPGNCKTENIVLRRGMTNSLLLWNWFHSVEMGKWQEAVVDGSLSIYDQAGREQARYDFGDAWPTRYKASDVNAQSSDIQIEELELVVHNLLRSK